MAGVVAQSDRGAVLGAQTALGGEDQVLGLGHVGRIPAHAGILGQAEKIAAGLLQEHVGGEGKVTGRSLPRQPRLVNGNRRPQNLIQRGRSLVSHLFRPRRHLSSQNPWAAWD